MIHCQGVFGTVRTEAYRRYLPPVLPVPDSSASSVRHQYRYRTLRYVRYDINTGTGHFRKFDIIRIPCRRYRYRLYTGTGHFGKFGTTSITVPDTSVSSVRHKHRYQILRQVRYDISTGTGHFGKFGMTSIPVPDTSVISVRHQYRYRTLRQVRHDMDTGTASTGTDFHTGTGHFANFGITSIPVRDTSVSSVRYQYRCRTLR